MFDTRNDLPAGKRSKVITLLNARLADAIDLGAQTKHAHWNVKGPSFIALHKLFDFFNRLAHFLRHLSLTFDARCCQISQRRAE